MAKNRNFYASKTPTVKDYAIYFGTCGAITGFALLLVHVANVVLP